ncbi:MAG TPA: hypothetical protein VGX21_17815 [Methylomirabilota bacterium]|jgi:hypothetical protein|nr:hypothetical protein [Methylomirabilota bacterium]
MIEFTTVLVAPALIFAACAFGSRWWPRTPEEEGLRRLASALGAVGKPKPGRTLTASHEGTPFEFTCHCQREYSSTFVVRVRAPSSGRFTVRKEGTFDRLSKKIGYSRKILTGDPAFDDTFYIEADAPVFAAAVFRAAERRQTVRDLFGLGFTSLWHDGKALRAERSPFNPDRDIDPARVRGAVPHLARLASGLAELPPAAKADTRPTRRVGRWIAFGVPGTLLGVVLVYFLLVSYRLLDDTRYQPLDRAGFFWASLRYIVPLLVAYVGFAAWLVRGRSSSHWEFYGIAFLSLGFLPTGSVLGLLLNAWLDFAPATPHVAAVVDSYEVEGGAYGVRLESWRKPGGVESVRVRYSVYRVATPKRIRMTVVTRPGRFGYEWVVSYEVTPLGGGRPRAAPR